MKLEKQTLNFNHVYNPFFNQTELYSLYFLPGDSGDTKNPENENKKTHK